MRSLGNGQADASQADDAERFARDLRTHVVLAIPAPFAQTLIRRGHVPRHCQEQGDRMLGRAERVARRGVHHDDTGPRGGGLVDVVGPHTSPHDGLQPLRAFQHVGGELHAAATNRPVELPEGLAKIRPLESRADFVFKARRGLQQIEAFLR